MENKINIAEILKDCPKGMKLYSPIFGKVYLDKIRPHLAIVVTTDKEHGDFKEEFLYDGRYGMNGECMLFPSKYETTWEGFQRPFEDGDIVISNHGDIHINRDNLSSYCCLRRNHFDENITVLVKFDRLATEEEKQKLFQAIKDNGYKWNPETKTLEKLIKSNFHESDWITNGEYTWKVISVDYLDYTLQNLWGEYVYDTIDYVNKAFHLWTINDAKDGDVLFHSDSASNGIFIFKEILQRGTIQKVMCYCDYDSEDGFCLGENHTCCWTDSKILHPATKEQRDILFQKMKEAGYKWNEETKTLEKFIEPKFKVGDTITNGKISIKIGYIDNEYYYELSRNIGYKLFIKNQDEWELISDKFPIKFNIKTLVPFESRVLVRSAYGDLWKPAIFGCYLKDKFYPYYTLGGMFWRYCIPYEKNEHLLGTTDDCDDYYKTWEQ